MLTGRMPGGLQSWSFSCLRLFSTVLPLAMVYFMSKTADLRTAADALAGLVLMPDHLASSICCLGFSLELCRVRFHAEVAYGALCSGEDVDWSGIDLEDLFFLY